MTHERPGAGGRRVDPDTPGLRFDQPPGDRQAQADAVRRGSSDSRPGTRKNFSNTRSRSSAGMPGPSSLTANPHVRIRRRPRR